MESDRRRRRGLLCEAIDNARDRGLLLLAAFCASLVAVTPECRGCEGGVCFCAFGVWNGFLGTKNGTGDEIDAVYLLHD